MTEHGKGCVQQLANFLLASSAYICVLGVLGTPPNPHQSAGLASKAGAWLAALVKSPGFLLRVLGSKECS